MIPFGIPPEFIARRKKGGFREFSTLVGWSSEGAEPGILKKLGKFLINI